MDRLKQLSAECDEKLALLNRVTGITFTNAANAAGEQQLEKQCLKASKRAICLCGQDQQLAYVESGLANTSHIIMQQIQKLNVSVQNAQNKAEIYQQIGSCLVALGDYVKAFSFFDMVVRNNQISSNPLFYKLGCIYQYFGDNQMANQCFTKALNNTDDYYYMSDLLLRVAILYRRMDNFQDAVEILSRIRDNPPRQVQTADIDLHIAYTHQCAKHYQQAITIYSQLYYKHPNNVIAFQSLLWAMYLDCKNKSNYKAAIDLIEQTHDKFQNNSMINLIRGRIYLSATDHPKAYYCFTRCINDLCSSPQYWCMLGSIYYLNDQLDDSLTAFQRALFLCNTMSKAWYNIATTYEQKGDSVAAAKLLQMARQSCPDFTKLEEDMKQHKMGTLLDIDDEQLIDQPVEKLSNAIIESTPVMVAADLGLPPSTDFNLKQDVVTSAFV